MFASVRYFIADVGHWLWAHRLVVAVAVIAVVALGAAVYFAASGDSGGGNPVAAQPAPAPRVVVHQTPAPEDTGDLGFPAFATKNTTRVAGPDPTADAAAVSLAVDPSTGPVAGPDAVTLVDSGQWPAAIAAASLSAAPVGAPVLITESGELPPLSAGALRALDPQGAAATAGRQVFVVGDAAEPDGYRTLAVEGGDAAELAAEVARLRERLAGEPDHILITTDEAAGYAMPAAGWAARSGDPVLFTHKDSLPDATVKALRRDDGVPVFVLGPESAISAKTMKEIDHVAPGAERVGDEGPVDNAIAFARYSNNGFGWNINDPGHGFVIANTDRPLDAAAAAPLSGSGTWGPLLVTDDAAALPGPLRGYLLDLKPGYESDPTRALYNHVWLIGDTSALSVDLQADVDELAEVAPVTSGSGSAPAPAPAPESQPDNQQQQNR